MQVSFSPEAPLVLLNSGMTLTLEKPGRSVSFLKSSVNTRSVQAEGKWDLWWAKKMEEETKSFMNILWLNFTLLSLDWKFN